MKSKIPEIKIIVAVSEDRKNKLAKALSDRLNTSRKLVVTINNIDNEEVIKI